MMLHANPRSDRSRRGLTATLSAIVLATCTVPPPALADPGDVDQSTLLCHGAPGGCRMSTDSWAREGASLPVSVHGNPGVRASVRVYRAVVKGTRLVGLAPISPAVEILTGDDGVATTDVALPATKDSYPGGWALVSTGDVVGTDTSRVVGVFVPLGTRSPEMLGDGYSQDKPAGQTLDLQVVGAIPGSRLTVEVRGDDNVWHRATGTAGSTTSDRPGEVSHVRWTVPRGLTNTVHEARLRNLSDPVAPSTFRLRPTVDGTTAPRTPVFVPPAVGTRIGQTSGSSTHPRTLVMSASAGLAGVCVVATVLIQTIAGRRRRHPAGEEARR